MKKIGIIGAGMIADAHVKAIRSDGRAEVTWIAGRRLDNAQKKSELHGIPNFTTDYKQVLKDPGIDAVIIATPPGTHKIFVIDSLQAGKDILLEKPAAADRQELKELCDAVKANNACIVMECSCRHSRLQPKFNFVKNLIDQGALGELYHIHHRHLMRSTFIEYNPGARWSLDKKISGGGPVIDWGVYDLAFHLGLLNDIPILKTIQSFTKSGLKVFNDETIHSDVEEHAAAYMSFDTGLTYYYERGAGVHCNSSNETTLYGTKGCLRFGYCSWDSPEIEFFRNDSNRKECCDLLKVDMMGHRGDNELLITKFLDCIINREQPPMNMDTVAKYLDIIYRILEK